MSRRTRLLLALLGALLVGVLLAINLPAARMIFALTICLLLPGLGWTRRVRSGDRGDTLALAIVLSTCMTVAVGTTMVLSRSWSLGWGLAALSGISVAGYLPIRPLLDRVRAAVRLQTVKTAANSAAGAQAPDAAPTGPAPAVEPWLDWYADVERRAEEAAAQRHSA